MSRAGSCRGLWACDLHTFDVDSTELVDGDNVVAVEIHHRSGRSSDIITLTNVAGFSIFKMVIRSFEDCAVNVQGEGTGIIEDSSIEAAALGVCVNSLIDLPGQSLPRSDAT